MKTEAAEHQASEGSEADSRGPNPTPNPTPNPNNPTPLLTTHEVYSTGGGTQHSQSVILDIGATHDIIGSHQATLASRVRILTELLLPANGKGTLKSVVYEDFDSGPMYGR